MPSFLRRLIAPTRAQPVVTSETITLRLPDGSEIAVLRARHPRPLGSGVKLAKAQIIHTMYG